VKLAQALKKKNRLVGEINRIKAIVLTGSFEQKNEKTVEQEKVDYNNVKMSDDVKAKFDAAEAKFTSLTDELIQLKTDISKANIGIYSKIVCLEELKNRLQTVESMQAGKTRVHFYEKYAEITTFAITEEEKELRITTIRKQIEDTQDEIDLYNATTDI